MKPLLLSLALLNGADSAITHVALDRGLHEVVLSQSPYVNHALLGGVTAAEWYALKEKRRLNTVLVVALIAVRGAVVVNNVNQLRRQR